MKIKCSEQLIENTYNIKIYLNIPFITNSAINKNKQINDSMEYLLKEKLIFYFFENDYF